MAIQAVRGMPDILPEQSAAWQFLETTVQGVFTAYGLRQIRTPLVEVTGLFARAVGDVTDIVEKEMYTFEDRSGESLTLRPELTAGVVRAMIEHGLLHNQTQRVWYQGPAFRYERPQKGRYRQFHQMGVECFGFADAAMDAELIEMTDLLWRRLGVRENLELQINSLGSPEARTAHREALVRFLMARVDQLDVESQARLSRNPLRILDSKDAGTQAVLIDAPSLASYYTEADQAHLARLCELLDDAGIVYRLNPQLVRGLDYYTRTVFEWITPSLGAQGTLCGGGRYDGLVEHLGGKSTPGVGFALGVERVVLLLETLGVIPEDLAAQADVYLMAESVDAETLLRGLARRIREACPQLRVFMHVGGGSLKSQLKKADRSGAQIGLVVGAQELAEQQVLFKPLRGGEQSWLTAEAVIERIKNGMKG